jgi:diacylglycerol kinase (ATP)
MKTIYKAFLNSISGLKLAFSSERAFKQEVYLAIVLIPVALLVEVSSLEKVFMIFSVLVVLIVELLNSGIEAVCDICSPEIHPLAKKAKDVASAAVLVALLNVVVVWGVILL